MPISQIDGCGEDHWADVLDIVSDGINQAGFEPKLVSNADDVGIIQKRIIQNLYENPIVVCDVSGKNPNVMFELGMRLAFDKPTVIIKDDKTSYSFDTAPIEHLAYPRDLRFSKIVEFKTKLIEKIRGTHEAASKDQNYTTFLKHFGEFKVAKIDTKEVSTNEIILEEIRLLRASVGKPDGLNNLIGQTRAPFVHEFKIEPASLPEKGGHTIMQALNAAGVKVSSLRHSGSRFEVRCSDGDLEKIRSILSTALPEISFRPIAP